MIPYNPCHHPAIWYGHHRTAQHKRKGGTSRKMKKTQKTSKKKLTARKLGKKRVLVFQVTAVTDRLNTFDFGSCTFDT